MKAQPEPETDDIVIDTLRAAARITEALTDKDDRKGDREIRFVTGTFDFLRLLRKK